MNLQLNKKNQAGAALAKVDNLAVAAATTAVAAATYDDTEITDSVAALSSEADTGEPVAAASEEPAAAAS